MIELTGYERETIINYNQAEKEANVNTYDPALIRKLDKLAEERDDIIKNRAGDYTFPKSWIKVRPPIKRNMTEEQRAALSRRMTDMHDRQNRR